VFHVYVEGVTGAAPDAMHALAEAMARRYGLPAGELLARLSRGRFRVKANVDQATADTYARDLESIGARVRIEAADPSAAATSSPPSGTRTVAPADRAPPRRTSPAGIQRATQPTGAPRPVPSPPSASPAPPAAAPPRPVPSPPAAGPPRPVPAPPSAVPAPSAGAPPRTPSVLPPAQPRPPRPALAAVPPEPELQPAGAQLPAPVEDDPPARAHRSSLPPQPARAMTGPLPAHVPSRPQTSSLPPQVASRPTTGPLPAHVPSRAQTPSLPPQPAGRTTRSSLPIPVLTDDDLAADDAQGSLGALDRGGLLSLASLDGQPDEAPSAARDQVLPASIGPARERAVGTPERPQAPLARPTDLPVDLFAPPGGAEADFIVELADDERERQDRKRNSTPPAMAAERGAPSTPPGLTAGRGSPSAPSTAAGRGAPLTADRPGSPSTAAGRGAPPTAARPGSPSTAAGRGTPSAPPGRTSDEPATRSSAPILEARRTPLLGDDPSSRSATPSRPPGDGEPGTAAGAMFSMARLAAPRARFLAGVLLAILLGFLPAHLIASLRERSADRAIDRVVTTAQISADTPDSYDALDGLRAAQLLEKRHAHHMIALTSLLIWAAAGGGLAYLWFRRVPWDRWS
jgi:hypothetical protein